MRRTVIGKGSGTIRDDAATREDASDGFFPDAALQTRRGSFFIRGGAHLSVLRGDPLHLVRIRAQAGLLRDRSGEKEGGYDVRVGGPVRETRSVTRAMVPSRIGVSCATFENVSFFQARTEGAKALNVCVLAHAASACQTDASASAARRATARFIVRVMTCRSICLLPRAEERGAQNPRDAFRAIFFFRLFVVTFRTVSPRA